MNIKYEAYSSFGIPFKVEGDKYIWNFPEEAPSQEAINLKIAELEKTKYQSDRLKEYPNFQECIHALLDGGDTLTELQSKRSEIKKKYPKET